MTRQRQTLARWGEGQAEAMLVDRGMILLEKNYRCPFGEVDLVLRDGDVLVFVEVKARTTDRFGQGVEAVHKAKQSRLRRLAHAYMRDRGLTSAAVRFDVVALTLSPRLQVRYIPGAF